MVGNIEYGREYSVWWDIMEIRIYVLVHLDSSTIIVYALLWVTT